ncbi:BtrH N-terminal domain-containing protein [Niabella soli]|uniref:Peptidase n=1 Tax=Niabella soli DSM 19437 TaxID=929713 RepID=W0F2X9_9BACT|nr:BtrH N-terminal domain-containing protein [Niabella soli]AHF15859.1 peptidase [Niabella soli DSM 19437]
MESQTANFNHLQAAHCENGVTTALLAHYGVHKLTEPLVFGIGSGLFYIQLPFMKVNGGPAISFRTMPGLIFKRTCKSLGIPVTRKKYRSHEKAMAELDERLRAGKPTACQVGVFYLTYFPKEYRFHFNAHNLIVVDKRDDNYIISDPIMEGLVSLNSYELERVRFAKGAFAPRGQMYYPGDNLKEATDEQLRQAIITGIKRNCRDMLHIPGNFGGVSGIAYTGKQIKKWKEKLGDQKARSYLAQLVRMQEEIGTGGGGFRFIYGAFLQQARQYLHMDELLDLSKQFTAAGDKWRDAAIQASGIYKGRLTTQADYDNMGDRLIEISALEKQAFQQLKALIKKAK